MGTAGFESVIRPCQLFHDRQKIAWNISPKLLTDFRIHVRGINPFICACIPLAHHEGMEHAVVGSHINHFLSFVMRSPIGIKTLLLARFISPVAITVPRCLRSHGPNGGWSDHDGRRIHYVSQCPMPSVGIRPVSRMALPGAVPFAENPPNEIFRIGRINGAVIVKVDVIGERILKIGSIIGIKRDQVSGQTGINCPCRMAGLGQHLAAVPTKLVMLDTKFSPILRLLETVQSAFTLQAGPQAPGHRVTSVLACVIRASSHTASLLPPATCCLSTGGKAFKFGAVEGPVSLQVTFPGERSGVIFVRCESTPYDKVLAEDLLGHGGHGPCRPTPFQDGEKGAFELFFQL